MNVTAYGGGQRARHMASVQSVDERGRRGRFHMSAAAAAVFT